MIIFGLETSNRGFLRCTAFLYGKVSTKLSEFIPPYIPFAKHDFLFLWQNFRNLLVAVPLTKCMLNVDRAKKQKLLQETEVLLGKYDTSSPVSKQTV